MSRIVSIITSLVLLMGLLNGTLGAAIAPSIVGYQGRLTDASDLPLTGTYSVTFRLYDAPVGGALIWQETHSAVNVQNGLFTAVLGQGTTPVPLNETHFTQSNRWLAVSIGAVEVSPRTQMTSVPFSTRVLTVDLARGGIISGQLELQADASKEGEAVSAALIVRGTNLSRQVRINPDLEVALSATSNDGDEVFRVDALETGSSLKIKGAANNVVASMNATPNGGDVSVAAVNGDVAAQLSADAAGGQIELFESSKNGRASVRRFWARAQRLSYFDPTGLTELMSVNTAGVLRASGLNASTTNSLKSLRLACTGGDNLTAADEDVPQGNGAFGQGNNLTAANNSFSVGLCNVLSGERNVTFGTENLVLGSSGNCFIAGEGDTIESPSFQSVAFGIRNSISASQAFVAGSFNRTTSSSSVCFGQANYDSSGLDNSLFGRADTIWASNSSSILAGQRNRILNSTNSAVVAGTHNLISGVQTSVIGGGERNRISSADNGNTSFAAALIAGGSDNIASSDWATAVGGEANKATGGHSFVGGGSYNLASGNLAAVAAGTADTASGTWSFVGAGLHNVATGQGSVVTGGQSNRASGETSCVLGGIDNWASGQTATVAGGVNDTASGLNSFVAGGAKNKAAGFVSFAAGHRAKANNQGSFVWGDSYDFDVTDSTANQFVARSTGGVKFFSAVDGLGVPTSGVVLTAGGGAWSSYSDREGKENVTLIDEEELLAKLSTVEISTWNYKSQDKSIRHIGPMAQDFFAAFGVGEDERRITTIDADGVALAAIQALYKKTEELKATTSKLKNQEDELAKMKEQLAQMQALLNKLAESKN